MMGLYRPGIKEKIEENGASVDANGGSEVSFPAWLNVMRRMRL